MGKEGNIFILFTLLICIIIGGILFYYIFESPEVSKTLFGDELGEIFAMMGVILLLLAIMMGTIWIVNKTNI